MYVWLDGWINFDRINLGSYHNILTMYPNSISLTFLTTPCLQTCNNGRRSRNWNLGDRIAQVAQGPFPPGNIIALIMGVLVGLAILGFILLVVVRAYPESRVGRAARRLTRALRFRSYSAADESHV